MKTWLLILGACLAFGCGGASSSMTVVPSPAATQIPAADGNAIQYVDSGGSGPAVLFIHGWSLDHSVWDSTREALGSSYRTIALDLPGHGKSGANRTTWNMSQYGADVAHLVTTLNLPSVILVGHSMGGPIAVEAARILGQRVTGVIGVDTFQDVATRWNLEPEKIAAMEKGYPESCREFTSMMLHKDTPAAVVSKVKQAMCGASASVTIPLMQSFADNDLVASLKGVSAPIVSINGDLWPTDIAKNKEYIPSFTVKIIPHSGHFPMIEKPAEFVAALKEVLPTMAPRVATSL